MGRRGARARAALRGRGAAGNPRAVGTVRALEIRPGDLLAGRYRVESELGRGGMGVVLAVRHIALDTRMALKVMRPDVAAEPESARRFLREARAAARIESDHVVRVFDVGTLDSGQPYMAMEHLEGMDLGRLLAVRGQLPPEEAVAFLIQAIDALGEAHSLGIVHRDLKPSNLFVVHRRDGTDELKVLDFGAAKIVKRSTPAELSGSTHSQLVGTPQYMSPEQLRATPDLDARTDIWSLGVILFQLVNGTLPFQGDSFPELCANIIAGSPGVAAETSPELAEVLRRCLAKAREARYASVHELEEALLSLAPESVQRARASKIVQRPAIQEPSSTTRPEQVLEMPSTVLQRFESSLAGTATASGARSDSFRSKRAGLALVSVGALVSIGVLFAGATLAHRLGNPAPPPDWRAASPAALQPMAAPEGTASVEPVPAVPATAHPAEAANPAVRPIGDPPRRGAPASRARPSALSASAASDSAIAPVSSSLSHSAMGGRL